jgi:hypothetical protein
MTRSKLMHRLTYHAVGTDTEHLALLVRFAVRFEQVWPYPGGESTDGDCSASAGARSEFPAGDVVGAGAEAKAVRSGAGGQDVGDYEFRMAVDIDGELAMLEQAMKAAERAAAMVAWLAQRRTDVEHAEHQRHEHWLNFSERTHLLGRVEAELDNAARQLSRAMVAPTTLDDEIPF